jgi:hypothetical protein
MLGQLLGHPWHIRWFLHEYVMVSPKKVDKREFLFVAQPGADHNYLGRVALLQLDGLHSDVVGVGGFTVD